MKHIPTGLDFWILLPVCSSSPSVKIRPSEVTTSLTPSPSPDRRLSVTRSLHMYDMRYPMSPLKGKDLAGRGVQISAVGGTWSAAPAPEAYWHLEHIRGGDGLSYRLTRPGPVGRLPPRGYPHCAHSREFLNPPEPGAREPGLACPGHSESCVAVTVGPCRNSKFLGALPVVTASTRRCTSESRSSRCFLSHHR